MPRTAASKRIVCDPQGIIDTLEAVDNNDDKIIYMQTVLDSCGVKMDDSGKGKKSKKPKSKRAMNSWNCYLKKCADTGMPFPECMKDEARKEKEYIPRKAYWKEEAGKGCP